MWILKCVGKPELAFHLLCNVDLSVTRKPGKNVICIPDDSSVSRQHAVVHLHYESSNLNSATSRPQVSVAEQDSKFGTYLNKGIAENKRIPSKQEISITEGDQIRFGMQWAVFRLEWEPLIVFGSTLEPEEKQLVQKSLLSLGGHFVSDWDPSCNHLVMGSLTLTVKAVSALSSCCHIVCPAYFEKCVQDLERGAKLPDPAAYLPPLVETTLNKDEVSFAPDRRRKTLFSGKRFVFLSRRQMKKLSPGIEAAGGSFSLYNPSSLKPNDLLAEGTIAIQQPMSSQECSEALWESEIQDVLRLNKKRLIPESDIGLAVLYCSLEKYCNPGFRFPSALIPQPSAAATFKIPAVADDARTNVLAAETPSTLDGSLVSPMRNIPTLHLSSLVGETLTGTGPSRTSKTATQDISQVSISQSGQSLLSTSTEMSSRKKLEANTSMPRPKVEPLSRGNTMLDEAVIDDVDSDDGEDLFAFGNSPKKRSKGQTGRPRKKQATRKDFKIEDISEDEADDATAGGTTADEDLFAFDDDQFNAATLQVDRVGIAAGSSQEAPMVVPKRRLSSAFLDGETASKRVCKREPESEFSSMVAEPGSAEFIGKEGIAKVEVSTADQPEDPKVADEEVDLNVTVLVVPLVRRISLQADTSSGSVANESPTNFKKFKKVHPIAGHNPSHVIGEANMITTISQASADGDEFEELDKLVNGRVDPNEEDDWGFD